MKPPLYIELPDGRRAGLTDHLIDRWRELTCPVASPVDAARLLNRMLSDVGEFTATPPEWVDIGLVRPWSLSGWVIAWDYAIPVYCEGKRMFAPTIVARGNLTPSERASRNQRARHERRRQKARHRRTAQRDARAGVRRQRRDQKLRRD